MKKFTYAGPVYIFNQCVADNWTSETMAVSREKALSNFKYQYKKKVNLIPNAMVNLPGQITVKKGECYGRV